MIIKEVIKEGVEKLKGKKIDSALLDAEVLLKETLKEDDRSFLYAHPEHKLTKKEEKKFKDWIGRRSKKEPIAYIINKKEFYGLDFYVDKRVFIPRPSSEKIIDEMTLGVIPSRAQRVPSEVEGAQSRDLKIIEIGTASGCIAVTLTKYLPRAKIYAIDISKAALKVARKNAKKHLGGIDTLKGGTPRIKFIHGDLLSKAPKGDIIIANLPYLSDSEYKKLGTEIKKYEPKMALVGGKDGLFYYKKLLGQIEVQYKAGRVTVFLEMEKSKAKLLKKSFDLNLPSQWRYLDPYWTRIEFNLSLS